MRNLFIILIIFVVYANCMNEKTVGHMLAKQIHRSCKKKTNVKLSELHKARKGNFNESQQELACYMKCILEAEKMLISQPNVTPQSMLSIFPLEIVMKFRKDDCQKDWQESNSCISAMRVFKCFHNKYGNKFSLGKGF